MDFAFSPKVEELRAGLLEFMEKHVFPAERVYREQIDASGEPHFHPPVMEELKAEARARGLWNLFLPDERWGAGLTNLEYAPLAEITGRSPSIAPEALNCSAPDTGNMEILAEFGTPDHQKRWLHPLLEGEIRSCFAMTEPDVASSDATNIRTRIERRDGELVLNGRKWFISGAMSDRCKVAIVMGVTDPDADPHRRHSMVLVPLDTPGLKVVRSIPLFGYRSGGGEAVEPSALFSHRVHQPGRAFSTSNRACSISIRDWGDPFPDHALLGQALSGRPPGRSPARTSDRKPRSAIPIARMQWWIRPELLFEDVRVPATNLLGGRGSGLLHRSGPPGPEISAIKVVAARMATQVIDRAIQVHGAAGVSDDFPLAELYVAARTLRIIDGPDEVHTMVIARRELEKYES